MTKEQKLMIQGMDMLLRKFSCMPDDTTVTVLEIIEASNEVYDKIMAGSEPINWDELYDKANRFLAELNVPYEVKRKRIVLRDNPICYVEFPTKGNKDIINTLKAQPCMYECMGHMVEGKKYTEFGIRMEKLLKIMEEKSEGIE